MVGSAQIFGWVLSRFHLLLFLSTGQQDHLSESPNLIYQHGRQRRNRRDGARAAIGGWGDLQGQGVSSQVRKVSERSAVSLIEYVTDKLSAVFRDMLFFPSTNETSTSGRPSIDIPVDAVALKLFVELLQQADPSPLSPDQYDGTIDALTSFMGLLDEFDCSKGIKSRALAHFQPIYEENPWAVFCLAARYGDFMSGKEAICHFGKVLSDADKLLPESMDPERAEALPTRWLLAYVRAHVRGGNGFKVSCTHPASFV